MSASNRDSPADASRLSSARMLADHYPPAVRRRGERGERGLGAHGYLPGAGGAAKLLDAVGVHRAPRAAVAQVAAARAEGVRTLHADVAGVELEGVAALHPVPLERFQVELRHDRIAVVRVEDIDVLRPHPGALVHSFRRAVGPEIGRAHV